LENFKHAIDRLYRSPLLCHAERKAFIKRHASACQRRLRAQRMCSLLKNLPCVHALPM
jgi:hypothetical protein